MSKPTPRVLVVDCSKPLDHPKREVLRPYNKTEMRIFERDQREAVKAEMERLRVKRNALLLASDWTEFPSAKERLTPKQQKAWADYRQALRDLPGSGLDFPEQP